MYARSFELTPPLFLILLCVISWIIIRKYKKKHQTIMSKDLAIHLIFLVYILMMVALFLLPIYLPGPEFDPSIWQSVDFMQLTPFVTIKAMLNNGNWFRQILGNIGLCVPVSFFLFYYSKKIKCWIHLTFGLVLALSFEAFQLLSNILTTYPNRVVDIDDVILNFFGVVLGYILLRLMIYMKDHKGDLA